MKPDATASKQIRKGGKNSYLGHFRVQSVCEKSPPNCALSNPENIVRAWYECVATAPWYDPEKEHMVVFVLNARLHLKGWSLVSIGIVNETYCHAREVLRPVIVAAGHGFAIAHNHPSGDSTPSQQDRDVTRRMRDCAHIMQIRMLDHLVIGSDSDWYSFCEHGLL